MQKHLTISRGVKILDQKNRGGGVQRLAISSKLLHANLLSQSQEIDNFS